MGDLILLGNGYQLGILSWGVGFLAADELLASQLDNLMKILLF